ncbi:hypothetical protein EV644_102473 [Kribbella orskensis]|uniref:Uncharacterized protein n=1 Tax=Kribbella orskensis TaxID=2512216 RepID=A0ABY2BUP6_9ACTN|nr:hypothetical protein EV642_102264 [Kribbella sp. VKM Ac-2500]TCO29753.1 hypothetical protein EV644_102473 [Kribbella orskensis]
MLLLIRPSISNPIRLPPTVRRLPIRPVLRPAASGPALQRSTELRPAVLGSALLRSAVLRSRVLRQPMLLHPTLRPGSKRLPRLPVRPRLPGPLLPGPLLPGPLLPGPLLPGLALPVRLRCLGSARLGSAIWLLSLRLAGLMLPVRLRALAATRLRPPVRLRPLRTTHLGSAVGLLALLSCAVRLTALGLAVRLLPRLLRGLLPWTRRTWPLRLSPGRLRPGSRRRSVSGGSRSSGYVRTWPLSSWPVSSRPLSDWSLSSWSLGSGPLGGLWLLCLGTWLRWWLPPRLLGRRSRGFGLRPPTLFGWLRWLLLLEPRLAGRLLSRLVARRLCVGDWLGGVLWARRRRRWRCRRAELAEQGIPGRQRVLATRQGARRLARQRILAT